MYGIDILQLKSELYYVHRIYADDKNTYCHSYKHQNGVQAFLNTPQILGAL